ncbi:lytic transglycosylase [Nioella halotolerans]|uniref:lytic transglycosylase n=1 Tax=Nioella halotolerans TaxID=2303578 RepID=UPI003F657410
MPWMIRVLTGSFICAASALSGLAQTDAAPVPAPATEARPVPRPDPAALAPAASPLPMPRPGMSVPELHWDELRPGMAAPADPAWGRVLYRAVLRQEALLNTVPDDIADWCPGYAAGGSARRAAFWAGLVSVLAWHESTHRAAAVGGGGRWFGLVQIAPATARARGCAAGSGAALSDGAANLRCAVRILTQTVLRDGVVSAGMRGAAAEWGPFHDRGKREGMRDWVSGQAYCRG